ncbi:Fc.00g046030.m01.CDS01 [Cosmosporella sp. VM-42]
MASIHTRTEPDPALCEKYAQFASHLGRLEFKFIYWTMFAANLVVLFLASWTYTRGQETLERFSLHSPKRAKRLRQSIFLCLLCVMVSTVIVIMEAYAIMALQFCDGEDLISLYWSTWTMIQVGSLIAMMGIILALCNSLRNRGHPPWALALGTPVLVIAGLLHLFHDCTKRRVKKQFKKMDSTSEDASGPPMSQANTIQVDPDNNISASIVGFTIQGGPIIRFTDNVPDPLPRYTELLGYCEENRPIIACHRDAVQFNFLTEVEEGQVDSSQQSCRKGSQ